MGKKSRPDITVELVVESYARHKSIKGVGRELGASPPTIRDRLETAGIVPKSTKNSRSQKMSNEEKRKYRAWRTSVMKRDHFSCQMCGNTGNLYAHHIRTWREYSELRFEMSNGITLCPGCHAPTMKREQDYEAMFCILLTYNGVTVDWKPRPKVPRPDKIDCTKCGEVKPLEDFSRYHKGRWGYKRWCKTCHNTHNRERARNNKDRFRVLTAAWYQKNKEYRRRYIAVWNMIKSLDSGKTTKLTPNRIKHGVMNEDGTINYDLINDFRKNGSEALKRVV